MGCAKGAFLLFVFVGMVSVGHASYKARIKAESVYILSGTLESSIVSDDAHVLQAIINAGLAVNDTLVNGKESLLAYAVRLGKSKVVAVLVQAGADISEADRAKVEALLEQKNTKLEHKQEKLQEEKEEPISRGCCARLMRWLFPL